MGVCEGEAGPEPFPGDTQPPSQEPSLQSSLCRPLQSHYPPSFATCRVPQPRSPSPPSSGAAWGSHLEPGLCLLLTLTEHLLCAGQEFP